PARSRSRSRLASSSDLALLALAEVLLEEFDRVLRQQQVRMREKISHVQVAGEDDLRAGQVLERPADRVVRGGQHDQGRAVESDRLQELGGLAGLRLVEDERLDDPDLAVDGLLAERAAQGEAANLLGHPLREIARPRAEDVPAAFNARLSRRAVADTAGAFLTYGLVPTARV